MELVCLGSSSKGNCYLLKASDGVLVVECGVNIMELKKALQWRLSDIIACIVTHEHKDHSKYLPSLQMSGIPILALHDVFKSQKLETDVFCTSIEPMRGYKVGPFNIFVLSVSHDVPCLGFVIEHSEMGKLLFITDTMMFQYRIDGINHILIEANYHDDILQQNIDNGLMPSVMRPRLLQSHMELKTTVGILKDMDLSQVQNIVLLHLSSGNSDKHLFQRTVAEATGKPVYIADSGLKLDMTNIPY